jgi:YD repeat-containing protein
MLPPAVSALPRLLLLGALLNLGSWFLSLVEAQSCPGECNHPATVVAADGNPDPQGGVQSYQWHASYPEPVNGLSIPDVNNWGPQCMFFRPQRIGGFTFRAIGAGYRNSGWLPGATCPNPPDPPDPNHVECFYCTVSFYITLMPEYAQNSGMRSSCSPPGAPPGGPPNVGKPIHVTTGNVWLDQADATIPASGAALSFVRSYNSLNAQQSIGGIFGPGWHHPYERRIDVMAGPTRALALQGPDGVPLYFQDNDDADDVYKPFAPITEQSTIEEQPAGSPVGFIRTLRAGGSEEYGPTGRLTALVDAFGKRTQLIYASDELATITDQSSGRALTLGYAGARLTSLTGPSGLVLASYGYDPAGRLETVTYTDDPATGYKFTYDPSGLLLTVSDLTDRVLETHTYVPGTGKGLTSEIADGKERLTLSYDANRALTTVTDALGNWA